eukprot:c11654_g1_i2.p2 GENE.c11654_g1_i2~~c11654_g1_i2.p2  ORF type:complete len:193 (+),score=52.29 c11654_g1_i2:1198-1776(+)
MNKIISEYGGHCIKLYDRFLFELPNYTNKDPSAQSGPYEFMKQTLAHYSTPARLAMDKIEIPTLLIHAADDPIVSTKHLNWDQICRNKNIIAMLTKRGGHVGWYEGGLPFGNTLAERAIVSFISAVFDSHSQTNFILSLVRNTEKMNSQAKSVLFSPASIARICSDSSNNLVALAQATAAAAAEDDDDKEHT